MREVANGRAPGRVTPGVTGLDEVMSGGLPPDRLYLVEEERGSGRTTLALRFLLEGAACGEGDLYVTLSESIGELRDGDGQDAARH